MTVQGDLFGEVSAGDPAPLAVSGQWREPVLTLGEIRAALNKAVANLADVPETLQPAYALAIMAYQARLDRGSKRLAEKNPPGSEQIFPRYCFNQGSMLPTQDVIFLMRQCREGMAGVEIRLHPGSFCATAAIYVPEVGTLELRHWPAADTANACYAPYRTPGLLPSYQDGRPRIALPSTVWEHACCAQKLAEAGNKMADVVTVQHNGREYVVTGIHWGPIREAQGWSIQSRQSWSGPAYTYRQLTHAYDQGDVERGDHRGQLVSVRGQVCVLEALSIFYDDRRDSLQGIPMGEP